MYSLSEGKLRSSRVRLVFLFWFHTGAWGMPTLLYLTIGAQAYRNLFLLLARLKILRGLE